MTYDMISGFTVYEFRLHDSVDHPTAQRRLAHLDSGTGPVPLLRRIDDARALALVQARRTREADGIERETRTAIDRVGAGLRTQDFRVRVALAAEDPGSHFRLALTDSGRNDRAPSAADPWITADVRDRPEADSQLLWIGVTANSAQGLFVLVGHDAEEPGEAGGTHPGWPLPLSSELGVRIYTGTRTSAG